MPFHIYLYEDHEYLHLMEKYKNAFFGLPINSITLLLYSKATLPAMESQGFLNIFILVILKAVADKFQLSREHFSYALLGFSWANSHWNILQLSCSYRIYPGISRWETSHNCCKEWSNFSGLSFCHNLT